MFLMFPQFLSRIFRDSFVVIASMASLVGLATRLFGMR